MSFSNRDETQVLLLQGGGALGAYQGGVFEKLHERGFRPDYVAGISIGAINSALIVGNRPEDRVERLHEFWQLVSSGNPLAGLFAATSVPSWLRLPFNKASANETMFMGIPGFFSPRMPAPMFQWPGTDAAISFYDTAPLRDTLLRLVDFDRLNSGEVRLAVGAVDVESGNMTYFDTAEQTLGPDHIMASGSLPPGFPPVRIGDRHYWDGGIVSNTPLQYVFEHHDRERDFAVFQVDLFNARGRMPETIFDIENREKDIRFSSRTRLLTDHAASTHRLRMAMQRLYEKLPEELRDDPDTQMLLNASHAGRVTIAHLIYAQSSFEREYKDYEFSRLSVEDRWRAGAADVDATLDGKAWKNRNRNPDKLTIIDCHRDH